MGLTSEPVSTDLYSAGRMAIELSTELRAWLQQQSQLLRSWAQAALRKRAELCSQQNWGSIREASGAKGCLMLQYFGTAVPASPFGQW